MEKTQHLGDRKAAGHRADKWRAHCFSGQKRNPTPIDTQVGVFQHPLIRRLLCRALFWSFRLPKICCGTGSWERVQPDCSIVQMAAAQASLNNEVEPRLSERASAECVVETTKSYSRFLSLTLEAGCKETLVDCDCESAMFCPFRHGASLLAANQIPIRQDRGTLCGWRDDIDILENERKSSWIGIRKNSKCPQVGLSQMTKSQEPQAR